MPEIRARNNRKYITRGVFCLVRAMPIARKRVAKHVPASVPWKNRTSISRQRKGKQPHELLRDGVFRGVRLETI
jgi:hypothetical protein